MAGRIDETLPFHPLNIAVLTISAGDAPTMPTLIAAATACAQ